MRLQFFSIPASDSSAESADLNRFLASHRVLEVERHFVAQSGYWAICVVYVEGESSTEKAAGRARIDYKEILSAEDFALFSRLRQARKEWAELAAIRRTPMTSAPSCPSSKAMAKSPIRRPVSRYLRYANAGRRSFVDQDKRPQADGSRD